MILLKKLVVKVNDIDTSKFVLKTKYDADKWELENKIPDTSGLVQKPDYNTKLTDIEGKIPDVGNLVTKAALITVENKIPNVSILATKTALTTVENKTPDVINLVKKTGYNTRVAEIDTKVSSLDCKIAENKTKNEAIKNELKESIKIVLSIFLRNILFVEEMVLKVI